MVSSWAVVSGCAGSRAREDTSTLVPDGRVTVTLRVDSVPETPVWEATPTWDSSMSTSEPSDNCRLVAVRSPSEDGDGASVGRACPPTIVMLS